MWESLTKYFLSACWQKNLLAHMFAPNYLILPLTTTLYTILYIYIYIRVRMWDFELKVEDIVSSCVYHTNIPQPPQQRIISTHPWPEAWPSTLATRDSTLCHRKGKSRYHTEEHILCGQWSMMLETPVFCQTSEVPKHFRHPWDII